MIYVAGPITKGDQFRNVADALDVGATMLQAGMVPFVPHLSCYWHVSHEQPYDVWLAYDLAVIERCDHLYRMPGESPGADREVAHARELGIPVWLPEHGPLDEFITAAMATTPAKEHTP